MTIQQQHPPVHEPGRERDGVQDPELERQGKRLAVPGTRFLVAAAVVAVPGIVLLIVGHSWVWAIGIALVAVSVPLLTVSVGALLAAAVARWAARHWPSA